MGSQKEKKPMKCLHRQQRPKTSNSFQEPFLCRSHTKLSSFCVFTVRVSRESSPPQPPRPRPRPRPQHNFISRRALSDDACGAFNNNRHPVIHRLNCRQNKLQHSHRLVCHQSFSKSLSHLFSSIMSDKGLPENYSDRANSRLVTRRAQMDRSELSWLNHPARPTQQRNLHHTNTLGELFCGVDVAEYLATEH